MLVSTKGEFVEDVAHISDMVTSFPACPETVKKVEDAIRKDVSLDADWYNYYNILGGYNCTGMAFKWLMIGGIKPPMVPYTPFLGPPTGF